MCKGNCKCNKSEAGKLQPGHFWAWVKTSDRDIWAQRIVTDAEKRKFVSGSFIRLYLDEGYYGNLDTFSAMTTTNPFKPVEMTVEEKAEVIREHFPKIMVRGGSNEWFRSIVGCDGDNKAMIINSENHMEMIKNLKEYTLDLGQTVKKFEKESK